MAKNVTKESLSRVFVSGARNARLQSVVQNRTDSVAIVLENISDVGNENAIVRAMDALGFYLVHRISTKSAVSTKNNWYRGFRSDAGARKWMTIRHWHRVDDCARYLTNVAGYKLVCASANASKSIFDLDVTEKMAIVFGNESSGVSCDLGKACELSFALPMYGFVESFNVSVAAAITLFHLGTQRRKLGVSGK